MHSYGINKKVTHRLIHIDDVLAIILEIAQFRSELNSLSLQSFLILSFTAKCLEALPVLYIMPQVKSA